MTDLNVGLVVRAEAQQAKLQLDQVRDGVRRLGEDTRASTTTAARSTQQLVAANAAMAGGFNSLRPMIQNASFQIGDFATQVAGGTRVSLALSQQLPQLLGGFGAMGAAAGALVAIMGALIPVLLRTEDRSKALADAMDDLIEASRRVDEATKVSQTSMADLAEKYGEAAVAARGLLAAQLDLAQSSQRVAAADAFRAQLDGLRDQLSIYFDLQDALAGNPSLSENRSFAAALAAALEEVREQFDLTEGDLLNLTDLMERSGDIARDDFGAMFELLSDVRRVLVDVKGGLDALPAPAREFVENGLDPALAILLELAGKAGDLPPTIADAAEAAYVLASAFGEAARQAASIRLTFAMSPDEAGLGFLAPRDGPGPVDTGFVVSPDDDGVMPPEARRPGGGRVDRAEIEAKREAERAAREEARAILEIARALDQLAPSRSRDIAAAEEWKRQTIAALDETKEGYAQHVADVEQAFDLMLAEAYERDLDRRTDWEAGVLRGLRNISDESRDFARTGQRFVEDLAGGFEDLFVGIATGTKDAGDALQDFGALILRQFAQIAAQRMTSNLVTPLLGNLVGGLFGGLGGSASGIVGFASGGIIDKPSFLPMAGEAGPEAILPLARDSAGNLGVSLAGGRGGDGGAVVVNVHNNAPNTQARTEERREGNQRIINVVVEQVKASIAGDIARGMGPIPSALSGTYGLNRVPR